MGIESTATINDPKVVTVINGAAQTLLRYTGSNGAGVFFQIINYGPDPLEIPAISHTLNIGETVAVGPFVSLGSPEIPRCEIKSSGVSNCEIRMSVYKE